MDNMIDFSPNKCECGNELPCRKHRKSYEFKADLYCPTCKKTTKHKIGKRTICLEHKDSE